MEPHQLTVEFLHEGGYFDVPVSKAAERLGMSAGSLKRLCRRLGLPRWPYRVRKSLRSVIARTEEFLDDEGNGSKQVILDSLKAQLDDVKGRGSAMDKTTRKYRQTVFKLNHNITKHAHGKAGRHKIPSAAAEQLLHGEGAVSDSEVQPSQQPTGSQKDTPTSIRAPCLLDEEITSSVPDAPFSRGSFSEESSGMTAYAPTPPPRAAGKHWQEIDSRYPPIPDLEGAEIDRPGAHLPDMLSTVEKAPMDVWPVKQACQVRAASFGAFDWRPQNRAQAWEEQNSLADCFPGLRSSLVPPAHLQGLGERPWPPPRQSVLRQEPPLNFTQAPFTATRFWHPSTLGEVKASPLLPPLSPSPTETSTNNSFGVNSSLQPCDVPHHGRPILRPASLYSELRDSAPSSATSLTSGVSDRSAHALSSGQLDSMSQQPQLPQRLRLAEPEMLGIMSSLGLI